MSDQMTTSLERFGGDEFEDLHDIFTCVWCGTDYETPLAKMKCFHFGCKLCLQTKLEDWAYFKFICPKCSAVNAVPPEGLQGFRDEPIHNKVRFVASIFGNTKPDCDFCAEKEKISPSTHGCITCQKVLCIRDEKRHQEMTQHKLLTIQELQQRSDFSKILESNITICQLHQMEKKIFCKDCEMLICPLCRPLEHSSHTKMATRDAAKEMKSGFESKTAEVLTTRSQAELDVSTLERSLETTEEDQLLDIQAKIDEEKFKINHINTVLKYISVFFFYCSDYEILLHFKDLKNCYENTPERGSLADKVPEKNELQVNEEVQITELTKDDHKSDLDSEIADTDHHSPCKLTVSPTIKEQKANGVNIKKSQTPPVQKSPHEDDSNDHYAIPDKGGRSPSQPPIQHPPSVNKPQKEEESLQIPEKMALPPILHPPPISEHTYVNVPLEKMALPPILHPPPISEHTYVNVPLEAVSQAASVRACPIASGDPYAKRIIEGERKIKDDLYNCELHKKWIGGWWTGVAFYENNILVAGGKNIGVFDLEGNKICQIECRALKNARDIEVYRDEIYVTDCDEENRVVLIIGIKGTLYRKVYLPEQESKHNGGFLGLALDMENGDIFVSSNKSNKVYKCSWPAYRSSTCSQATPFITKGLTGPNYMCVVPGHALLVSSENNTIKLYDSTGKLLQKSRFGAMPQGICVDPWGQVYIAHCENHRIDFLSMDGSPVVEIDIGEEIWSPWAIKFKDDKLVITTGPGTIFVIKCPCPEGSDDETSNPSTKRASNTWNDIVRSPIDTTGPVYAPLPSSSGLKDPSDENSKNKKCLIM